MDLYRDICYPYQLILLYVVTYSGHKNVVPLITAFRFMDQVIVVLPYFEHRDFRVCIPNHCLGKQTKHVQVSNPFNFYRSTTRRYLWMVSAVTFAHFSRHSCTSTIKTSSTGMSSPAISFMMLKEKQGCSWTLDLHNDKRIPARPTASLIHGRLR
jgi:hypothetical protein